MEGLSVMGIFGFILSILLWTRVRGLERILRENGIRPKGAKLLGKRLQEETGKTLFLTLYDGEIDGSVLHCKILDADEEWALVLVDEGKKKEREVLIRLDSVKQMKS